MLLSDFDNNSNIRVIEEASSKNNYRPTVRGLFQRADEANQNKRIYPKTILENQVRKLQPLISERRLCGELDHPQSDTVKLTNASHLVTKLWMEGAEVFGEAEILNTPNGKVAQALINDGVKIGISSRGLGTLSENQMNGTKTVNEDFNLVTFDLVADPSTRGAYPTLAESRILEEAKYERTLKEAVGERVFITLLNNTLNEGKKKREHPGQQGLSWWEDPDMPQGAPEGGEDEAYAARVRANLSAQNAINKKAAGPGRKPKKVNLAFPQGEDEPEHLAARRRANLAAQNKINKKAAGPGREDSSREYFIDRSLEKLEEKYLRDRVKVLRNRQLYEDSQKGYAEMGIKGGTKAAAKEALKRKRSRR
jgi:hypothetical protein